MQEAPTQLKFPNVLAVVNLNSSKTLLHFHAIKLFGNMENIASLENLNKVAYFLSLERSPAASNLSSYNRGVLQNL
jgi:hypothetical protein